MLLRRSREKLKSGDVWSESPSCLFPGQITPFLFQLQHCWFVYLPLYSFGMSRIVLGNTEPRLHGFEDQTTQACAFHR